MISSLPSSQQNFLFTETSINSQKSELEVDCKSREKKPSRKPSYWVEFPQVLRGCGAAGRDGAGGCNSTEPTCGVQSWGYVAAPCKRAGRVRQPLACYRAPCEIGTGLGTGYPQPLPPQRPPWCLSRGLCRTGRLHWSTPADSGQLDCA